MGESGAMSPEEEAALRSKYHLYVNQNSEKWRFGELGRDWPDGRGIYVSHDSALLGWTNEEEHLQLLSVDYNANISSVCMRLWRDLSQIELHLNRLGKAGYTRHPFLGYLSTSPDHIGLGTYTYRITLTLALTLSLSPQPPHTRLPSLYCHEAS